MPASLTPLALALLAAAGLAALADWALVAREGRAGGGPGGPAAGARSDQGTGSDPAAGLRPRVITKPLVLVLLIGVALALTPQDPAVRAWFVVALACSLAGDVALLSARGFVVGLAAFLLAHVAYAVGFVVGGVGAPTLLVGLAAMLVFDIVLARRLVPALRASGRGSLVPPVLAYMTAITAMVAAAAGSAIPLAMAGAVLFAASDAILADGRFVRRRRRGDLAVMVLYHLGQVSLVLSLVA
jgi:uncharacterized membrane protein YhhN